MWYEVVLVHVSFLESIQHLVLDEADRLLDREFLPQVQEILGACSSSGIQKAVFSATLPAEIEKLALKILHNPIRVVIGMKYVLPVTWRKVLIQSLSY
jgi:ATP-dependent RNA helicase DDX52/ROK1